MSRSAPPGGPSPPLPTLTVPVVATRPSTPPRPLLTRRCAPLGAVGGVRRPHQPGPTNCPACGPRRPAPPGAKLARSVRLLPARIRHGRPLRLLARIVAAVLLALVVARSGAGGPPIAGVLAELVLWLGFTIRADLAPPPGR